MKKHQGADLLPLLPLRSPLQSTRRCLDVRDDPLQPLDSLLLRQLLCPRLLWKRPKGNLRPQKLQRGQVDAVSYEGPAVEAAPFRVRRRRDAYQDNHLVQCGLQKALIDLWCARVLLQALLQAGLFPELQFP